MNMTGNPGSSPSAVIFSQVAVTLSGEAILDRVSARIPAGGGTAVVGPNGAGKTTLLMALLGELPYAGDIVFPVHGARPRLGYVPQKLDFDPGLPLTVEEFICLNWRRLPLWFGTGRKYRRLAQGLMDDVGIRHLAKRRLGELSGGEMRRALLALAMGRAPELLILDEPTAGVDHRGEMAFYRLLDHLRLAHGFTQLMVCHNLSAVRRHATHVICLNRRVLAEGPPETALTSGTLTRTFMGREAECLEEADGGVSGRRAERAAHHA